MGFSRENKDISYIREVFENLTDEEKSRLAELCQPRAILPNDPILNALEKKTPFMTRYWSFTGYTLAEDYAEIIRQLVKNRLKKITPPAPSA